MYTVDGNRLTRRIRRIGLIMTTLPPPARTAIVPSIQYVRAARVLTKRALLQAVEYSRSDGPLEGLDPVGTTGLPCHLRSLTRPERVT